MIWALLLTILVEWIVAYGYGLRKKDELAAVALVNLITNPMLNYIIWVVSFFHLSEVNAAFILAMEILVVIVEWRLLLFSLGGNSKRFFKLSLLMNLCSYLTGFFIFI